MRRWEITYNLPKNEEHFVTAAWTVDPPGNAQGVVYPLPFSVDVDVLRERPHALNAYSAAEDDTAEGEYSSETTGSGSDESASQELDLNQGKTKQWILHQNK